LNPLQIFNDLTRYQKMRTLLLVFMMITIVIFLYLRGVPVPLFTSVFLGLLTLWVVSFYFEKTYQIEDIPLLLLIAATFAFGRAVSIIPIVSFGNIPIPITEIVLALSLGLMLLRGKSSWDVWTTRLPLDLKILLPGFLLLGTLYLLLGLKENGTIAFRDIVFCHYMLFLFVTLKVFHNPQKIKRAIAVFIPSAITLLAIGFIMYFITRSGQVSFIKFLFDTREFNWALYYGLTAIFGLSFFTLKNKREIKWGIALLIYFGLLFILLTRVRAGWFGLIPAIILLLILLKKEVKALFVIIPLIAVTVLFLDLCLHKNIFFMIKREIKGITPGKRDTRQKKNVAFRLIIWKQTLEKTWQKPLLGWGYGSFPTYYIHKKPLHRPSGEIGPGSKITPAHNHVLAVTYKMGFLGLAIFIFMNLRIFLMGVMYFKKCKSLFNQRLLAASLGGLVYWHGMALFFDVLESPPTGIFLWILLGLIISIVHVDKHLNQTSRNQDGLV